MRWRHCRQTVAMDEDEKRAATAGRDGKSRVEALVERLTVDEKASLTAGQDLWTVPGVPRVGIPSVGVTDGPNGARGTTLPGPEAEPTTCVPCGSALGATWDPDLVGAVGALLGAETRAKGCNHKTWPPRSNTSWAMTLNSSGTR